MRNVWKALVLSVAVLVLTGCGVAGKWTLDTITPEEARGDYGLACISLNKDGTYTARAQKGDETVVRTGTYTFEDNQLCLTSAEGKTRTYDARLMALGAKLEVKTVVDDEEVVAIMKRCECKKRDECGKGEKCEECEKCEKHHEHEEQAGCEKH